MEEFAVIGKRTPLIDAPAKATGQVKYVADLTVPGMLHGAILRSPYPHARILNVDASRALRLPGVKAAVTGRDTRGRRYGLMPLTADELALAIDKVNFIGEAVAAVAALDEDTARAALDYIKVDYEKLPAVLDPKDALQDGAPQIHEHAPGNISCQASWHFGDVDEGFRQAGHIREDTFETQAVTHAPLEPHGTLASYDQAGVLTVWASTQNLYLCRLSLSITLGIPEGRIHIIKPTVGGGFGGKVEMYAHDFAASLLSMKTGRPVRVICSRDEVFSATRYRNPMSIWMRTGVKKDGTLLARDCRVIADGGAYTSTGPGSLYLAGMIANTPYRLPSFRYEGIRAYTNKPPAGPQRGHGVIQGTFAVESQMDMIAHDLGLDPLEMRRRNATRAGYVMANNVRVNSCGLSECFTKVATSIEGWGRQTGRGHGMAAGAFTSGQQIVPHLHASAIIKIHYDGAVTLYTGAPDIGQGSNTVLAQIAAEELGMNLEDIRVVAADSETTPMDSGAYSSRVTVFVGNAVKEAAAKAKSQLLEAAAVQLEARWEDLEARAGRIWVKGSPDRGLTSQQAARAYLRQKEEPIVAHGTFHQTEEALRVGHGKFLTARGDLPEDAGLETPSPSFSFAAQAAEVAVDVETGEVKVLRYVASHDSGRALNPMAVEGQIEGSIAGGMGQALAEGLDRKEGQTLNPSFLDYHLLTALEMPACEVWEVDAPDPVGPFGAKESGEGTQVPGPAAIANAVFGAVGVRLTTLPITPEKVLASLQKRNK